MQIFKVQRAKCVKYLSCKGAKLQTGAKVAKYQSCKVSMLQSFMVPKFLSDKVALS
jgi:hypothetical protein